MSTSSTMPAINGELYVALAYTTDVFPATIDDKRADGYAVPRFRRVVAERVAAWLNTMHQEDPAAWRHTASFNGGALHVVEAGWSKSEVFEADADGRYMIGSPGWQWEISAPPADGDDLALLDDSARLSPQGGEILVTINIDGSDPVFPALLSETYGWSRAGCPRFRRPVADVVVAWIKNTAANHYDGSELAYWDGDAVVLVDHQAITEDGYVPARISADEDGRYAIGAGFEWERADAEDGGR